MNGEEDENSLFGTEESRRIYTIPYKLYNLNFHYILKYIISNFNYSIE